MLLKSACDPVNKKAVKIIAAETRVAVAGLHLHHAVLDNHQGNVKGAAAKIVHEDPLVLFVPRFIDKGSRRGLVNDPCHVKTGQNTRILRRLALGIVKIGRNGDNCLRDLLAEVSLGLAFQFGEDKG
ncbi:MAG: NAD-specific glutamate dehydrogenase [Syntrophorhabdaceae bacterium PtaU1.Bin034]|nr:MAG: NAD-specific glutamate dehydrogenase [Syntrophorhabdaceae bacterium PtaU1.Bin034]